MVDIEEYIDAVKIVRDERYNEKSINELIRNVRAYMTGVAMDENELIIMELYIKDLEYSIELRKKNYFL